MTGATSEVERQGCNDWDYIAVCEFCKLVCLYGWEVKDMLCSGQFVLSVSMFASCMPYRSGMAEWHCLSSHEV